MYIYIYCIYFISFLSCLFCHLILVRGLKIVFLCVSFLCINPKLIKMLIIRIEKRKLHRACEVSLFHHLTPEYSVSFRLAHSSIKNKAPPAHYDPPSPLTPTCPLVIKVLPGTTRGVWSACQMTSKTDRLSAWRWNCMQMCRAQSAHTNTNRHTHTQTQIHTRTHTLSRRRRTNTDGQNLFFSWSPQV